MFRVHRRLEDGSPNAIVVRRLKDKLGTRSLPTAELELEGALAFPVGDPLEGSGVRRISTMLNLTRIHNAIAAAAALARGLAWARAYARVREVFGAPLHQQPAHRATLTDLAVDHAAALALVLRCCELIGKVEKGTASDEETRTLRGLTPITKLATARWAVAGTAEAMEAIGGVAYCEDSTIPALVRNAHVLPIWEGTTNVLALDLLRAEARAGALEAVVADAARLAYSASTDPALAGLAAQVTQSLSVLSARVRAAAEDRVTLEASARSVALGLATTHACASLLAQATWATGRNLHTNAGSAAARLTARGLVPPEPPADLTLGMDEAEAPEPHVT